MEDPPTSDPTGQSNPASVLLAAMQESSFAGPLPHPELLKGYEEVCPGAAQRIIAMAETQSTHRRKIEQQISSAAVEEMRLQFTENRRGQIFAICVSLAFLLAGVYVIVSGHPWPGAVIGGVGGGGVGLPAIVAAFLRRSPPSGDTEPHIATAPTTRRSNKRKH